MEQRPLRLGDTVDDYCPRERRLTNHVVVAIVGDVIRQTRCSTCDAEHVYKAGKEPRRRKRDSALFDQVLADAAPGQLVVPRSAAAEPVETPTGAAPDPDAAPVAARPVESAPAAEPPADSQPDAPGAPADDHWPAHRQLIRATLP